MAYKEFNPVNKTKITVKIICPNCKKAIEDAFKIPGAKESGHKDETLSCCGETFNITIQADAGSGVVTTHDNRIKDTDLSVTVS
jgi:hypothetical protein